MAAFLATLGFSLSGFALLAGRGADPVFLIGSVGGMFLAMVAFLMSGRARRFLDADMFARAQQDGAAHFRARQYLNAALTLKEALSYGETPGVRLGLACALEHLGGTGLAIEEYARAYHIIPRRDPSEADLLAVTAECYARALWRHGGEGMRSDAQAAFEICDRTLAWWLKEVTHPEVDKLRLLRGVLLMHLRRDAEARDHLTRLAETAEEPDTRRLARTFAFGASIVERVRTDPDWLFERAGVVDDAIRRRN